MRYSHVEQSATLRRAVTRRSGRRAGTRAGDLDPQMSLALEPGADGPAWVLRVKGDRMREAGILDGDLVAIRKMGGGRSAPVTVTRIDRTAEAWVAVRSSLPAVTLWGQPLMLSGSEDIEGVFVGMLRQGRTVH